MYDFKGYPGPLLDSSFGVFIDFYPVYENSRSVFPFDESESSSIVETFDPTIDNEFISHQLQSASCAGKRRHIEV